MPLTETPPKISESSRYRAVSAAWCIWNFTPPRPSTGAEYCPGCVCMSVCLSVCLCQSISRKLHVQTSPNFLCMRWLWLERSFSGGFVMCYVFPVLWTTSCKEVSILWSHYEEISRLCCLEKEITQGALEQCQVHTGEEDHAQPGWTTSKRGQDSPWKSQSEWQAEDRAKWRKYVHGVANPRIEDG